MRDLTKEQLLEYGLSCQFDKQRNMTILRNGKKIYPYKNSRNNWYIRFTINYKTISLSLWKVAYIFLYNKPVQKNEDVICKREDSFSGINLLRWHYESLIKVSHKEAIIYGLEKGVLNEKGKNNQVK